MGGRKPPLFLTVFVMSSRLCVFIYFFVLLTYGRDIRRKDMRKEYKVIDWLDAMYEAEQAEKEQLKEGGKDGDREFEAESCCIERVDTHHGVS